MTPTSSQLKIGLVGYGRLAKHLAPALQKAGIEINQWYVRNRTYRSEIIEQFDVDVVHDLALINNTSDVILIMVSDGAITEVAGQLKTEGTIVCHSSGMSSVDALPQADAGIFYPLNTFNGISPTWDENTPIFIQAKINSSLIKLRKIASQISNHVQLIEASKLQIIHLAAVISQNFSNHLIGKAEQILNDQGVNREVIQPLLASMIRNLKTTPAVLNQTGPAVRQDSSTINKQIELLENDAQLKEIYKLLTESIQANHFK